MNEKRMAGDYEITVAVSIGTQEVVMGENPKEPSEQYMCATYKPHEIFASYEDVMASHDYAEIAELFGNRVAEKARECMERVSNLDIDPSPITPDMCYENDYRKSIDGKVVALKLSSLKPEFRTADSQLYVVTGGFGAQANSRGNAVYCTNLYTGKQTRWERYDVQGEVKLECIPAWAKEKLKELQVKPTEKQKSKEER